MSLAKKFIQITLLMVIGYLLSFINKDLLLKTILTVEGLVFITFSVIFYLILELIELKRRLKNYSQENNELLEENWNLKTKKWQVKH